MNDLYLNQGKPFTVSAAAGRCFASNNDMLKIDTPKVPDSARPNKVDFVFTPKNPATNPDSVSFWQAAKADYDPDYGVILGSSEFVDANGGSQERNFSIALDRTTTAFPATVNVYISENHPPEGQPDDGSWVGH